VNSTVDSAPPPTPGVSTAVRYRLSTASGRFRWTCDGREVATAWWRDHCWDVQDTARGAVALSLVGGSYLGHTRVALVDHPGRRTFTFAPGEPVSRAHIGTVTDTDGNPVVFVRADGPTGLHLIDPGGGMLALTSRRRAPGSGCDVLVLPAGAAVGTTLVLGLTLALELLRTGGLRSVA
jgi:hypothetical protein